MKKSIVLSIMLMFVCVILFSSSVQASLVAHYTFDGNANDSSGNGNNGVVRGDLQWVSTGINGNAAEFNGQNSYIEVPNSPTLDIAGPITLATWIKADFDQYFRVGLISKSSEGYHPFLGYHLRIAGELDQPAHFALYNEDSSDPLGESGKAVASINPLNDNQWHHIAATYDGNLMKMYIDGQFNSETINTEGYSSNNDSLLIGNFVYLYNDAHGNEPNILNGLMDDVRIYDHALTASEVSDLASVPIPSAIWLLGSGLIGFVGLRRKIKKDIRYLKNEKGRNK